MYINEPGADREVCRPQIHERLDFFNISKRCGVPKIKLLEREPTMKSIGKAIFFGFMAWLIAFIVAIIIYPLKEINPPFFETIMPIVLTVCGVLFSIIYFKGVEANFVKEGLLLGIIFFVLNNVIDLGMFMWGPMKMGLGAYMTDIGLTYLIYPIITTGFGYMIARVRTGG
jgi:hypothetical protein